MKTQRDFGTSYNKENNLKMRCTKSQVKKRKRNNSKTCMSMTATKMNQHDKNTKTCKARSIIQPNGQDNKIN